jgi:asparagine synthase (glutamine-hydrolysing)
MLRAEFHEKMVNNLLLCEDRMTSAHGIEGRVPFLDRDLVELAFRIPAKEKMRGRETKTLWKDSVGDRLPQSIVRKKKQGFCFNPHHHWESGLRPAVERELTREWCEDTGIFNYEFIQTILNYPPHGNLRWHYFVLWQMVGLKYWIDQFSVNVRPS